MLGSLKVLIFCFIIFFHCKTEKSTHTEKIEPIGNIKNISTNTAIDNFDLSRNPFG